jgi:hypothetical protein
MATWLKLLIGLAVATAAVLALVELSRKRSSAVATDTGSAPALASGLSNMWAVSDSLQQTHINTLSAQVSEKVSRADVAQMIQQALATLPAGTGSGSTEEDIDLIARFNARYNQN